MSATQTLLPLATRTVADPPEESPAIAQPANIATATFQLVAQNWTNPTDVVRLEVWESPDATSPFVLSLGRDFPGGYTPRPGHPGVPGFSLDVASLLYPRARFPAARLFGRCLVTAGTVRFRLDLTTT